MKELQKAMNDFSEVVKKATGGYSTFSRESGAWERQLPPNQIASFDHPSDETIIGKEGSLVVLYRKAKIFLQPTQIPLASPVTNVFPQIEQILNIV